MTSPNPNNEPGLVAPHDLNRSLESAETNTGFERISEDGVDILCEPSHISALKHKTLTKTLSRKDIASNTVSDTEGLIRFVVGPDGQVVPDLLQKLPGRGLWVKADRDSLNLAIKKNLFARAAKRQVKVLPELSGMVADLLRRRCLELLGLARREGEIVSGFEKVAACIRANNAAWLIEAHDASDDGRSKLLALARAQTASPKLCGLFSNDELSLALGLDNAVHLALIRGKRLRRWSHEVGRLSGFEVLAPDAWHHGVKGKDRDLADDGEL